MILETIRIMRDALRHESAGVNAQIRDLETDEGDPRPRTVDGWIDATDTRDLVSGDDVPTYDDPWIAIIQEGPARIDGESRNTVTADGDSVRVGVLWGTRRDGAETLVESLYVLRAIVKAVRALMTDPTRAGERARNAICVLAINSIEYGPVEEEVAGGVVRGAAIFDLFVRDTAL